MPKVFSSTEQQIVDSIGNQTIADLFDTTITAVANTDVLVRNVANDKWINDRINLETQAKNLSTAKVYYDFPVGAGELTGNFPATFTVGGGPYPPVGEHTASKIYVNTTEKVVFISNQANPANDDRGAGGVGEGANAMTAYIAALCGSNTGVNLSNYRRVPIIKFVAGKSTVAGDDPVRQINFRVRDASTTGSSLMPNSTTTNTVSARYGGTLMNDSSWTWFKYENSNLEEQIWGDIKTTYNRWWTTDNSHEAYPVFMKVEDAGNANLTSVATGDYLVRSGADWVNQGPVSAQIYYTSRNAQAELNGASATVGVPFKLGADPTTPITYTLDENSSEFTMSTNGRLAYVGRTFKALVTVCGAISFGDNDRAFEIQIRTNAGTVELANGRTVANAKNALSKADDFSKTFLVTVSSGTNFEVWANAIDNNTAITFRELNLSIVSVD